MTKFSVTKALKRKQVNLNNSDINEKVMNEEFVNKSCTSCEQDVNKL